MLGKHVWQVAAIVIISLLFSLVEALVILPAHLAHSKALGVQQKSNSFTARIRESLDKFVNILSHKIYSPLLRLCLRNRWAVSATILAVILVISSKLTLTFFDFEYPNQYGTT